MELKNTDVEQIQIHYCNGALDIFNTSKSIEEIVKRVNGYKELEEQAETLGTTVDMLAPLMTECYNLRELNRELVEALKNTLKTINGVRSKSELLEDEIKRFGLDDYWELIEKAEGVE